MAKKKVGILYGGRSVEHEISIRSARNIFENLNRDLFEPILIGIDHNGNWFLQESVAAQIQENQPLKVSLKGSQPDFNFEDQSFIPDVIFPVLHGTDGEDGSIQGFLQMMDLPCVGSGVLGSSVSMDKILTKELLNQAGIPTVKYVAFPSQKALDGLDFDEISQKLGLPFIIKPGSLGSSVGVSLISDVQSFNSAIKTTSQYDDKIILEQFIKGRELECAILGNEAAEASDPGEIIVNKDDYDFYTYNAKYMDPSAAEIKIPAKLEPTVQQKIKDLSLKTYNLLRCEDYARVDLFYGNNHEIYINEVNTIPGFTNSSMFPMMWQHHGISFPELITRLIDLSMERFLKRNSLITDYIPGSGS